MPPATALSASTSQDVIGDRYLSLTPARHKDAASPVNAPSFCLCRRHVRRSVVLPPATALQLHHDRLRQAIVIWKTSRRRRLPRLERSSSWNDRRVRRSGELPLGLALSASSWLVVGGARHLRMTAKSAETPLHPTVCRSPAVAAAMFAVADSFRRVAAGNGVDSSTMIGHER